MPLYTVHAPPTETDTPPDPLRFVFVKEGFCWPALFIPELWLLFRRMWLLFLLYLLVVALAYVVDWQFGGALAGAILVPARLLFAVEGNGLRRWTLQRQGYTFVGVVSGRSVGEAEVRYFFGEELQRAESETPPARTAVVPIAPMDDGDAVGVFPTPGGYR